MHHDDAVESDNSKKPEIMSYYNSTKSGVDNLDHLVGLYTCKRKICRWPMTFFFNMIDTAVVAAYVVWCCKHPYYQNEKSHKRRLFLIDLAESLVSEHLTRRRNNPQTMQRGVKLAFKALGFHNQPNAVIVAQSDGKQHRQICPRAVDRKTRTRCSECRNPCCQDHSSVVCDICHDND